MATRKRDDLAVDPFSVEVDPITGLRRPSPVIGGGDPANNSGSNTLRDTLPMRGFNADPRDAFTYLTPGGITRNLRDNRTGAGPTVNLQNTGNPAGVIGGGTALGGVSQGVDYGGDPVAGPFTPPLTIPPVVTDAEDGQPTRDRLEELSERTIDQMFSGAWTEPLRERQTEMAARQAMQMRGAQAQRVADADITGQGAGVQAMQGTEQSIREMTADNAMLTAMAEQEAKERGIGYAQNLLWFKQSKEQNENQEWWKEFTYLMQIDPKQAAELYTDKTGRPIDVTAIQGTIDRSNIADVRSTSRTIIADMALDPNNEDIAFASVKDYIKQEIAFDTNRDISEVSDDEARKYFNGLWDPAVASPSTQLYNQLANSPEIAQYFDTPKEREIVAQWAVKTTYGGLDADGNIKEGWPMPWEDPETAHWFKDLVTGEETDPSADADPNIPLPDNIQIVRNGETINVSQDSVRSEFDKWADYMTETEPEFFLDSDTFNEWLEHYKNDTVNEYDPMAEIWAEEWPELLTTAQAVEGNEKLVSGTGTTATVNETLSDYVPRILNAIDNGTVDEMYPDMYAGSLEQGTGVRNSTNPVLGMWRDEGYYESGKRRTVLTDKAKQFIDENRGEIITIASEATEGKPEKFVILSYTDDTGGYKGVQKIKLRRLSNGNDVYLGTEIWKDSDDKFQWGPLNFMPADYHG